MKVLIVRHDHLGDLVLTTPLIRALSLAGQQVTVIARRSSLPVLEGNPHVRNLLAMEDLAPDYPRGILALGSGIRKLQPDLVLVPHAKPRWLLLSVRAGYWGKVIAMYGGVISRLLLCRSLRSGLPNHLRHISDIWLDLARSIKVLPDGLQPEIFLASDEKKSAKEQLVGRFGSRKVVVIHPGCSGNTCNLPIETYVEFIDRLLLCTEVAIVLTGLASERDQYATLLSRYAQATRVWNSMGELGIRQLCAVIAHASALCSVGTGPMHLASALVVPTVTPFCRKIGVCNQVWGNQGAKNITMEPPADICALRGNGEHCDFEKSIGVMNLMEALRPFIESSGGEAGLGAELMPLQGRDDLYGADVHREI